MATKVGLVIEGVPEVARAFKELEPRVARKVIRRAERKAAKLFRDEIAAHVPVASGLLKSTLKVRASKGPRGSKRGTVAVAVLVGQAGGPASAGAAVKRAWYGYLQEAGYTLGKRIREGKRVAGYVPLPRHRGSGGVRKMPGRRFVRRALHSREPQARELLVREIALGIDREARALGGRGR